MARPIAKLIVMQPKKGDEESERRKKRIKRKKKMRRHWKWLSLWFSLIFVWCFGFLLYYYGQDAASKTKTKALLFGVLCYAVLSRSALTFLKWDKVLRNGIRNRWRLWFTVFANDKPIKYLKTEITLINFAFLMLLLAIPFGASTNSCFESMFENVVQLRRTRAHSANFVSKRTLWQTLHSAGLLSNRIFSIETDFLRKYCVQRKWKATSQPTSQCRQIRI